MTAPHSWEWLVAQTIALTKRPDLLVETSLSLRHAIRVVHRQGKFWRDLRTVHIVPSTLDAVQALDLETNCPNLRQLVYLKHGELELYYKEADLATLLDKDGQGKVDVYWGIGTVLNVRAAKPASFYELAYYMQPSTSPVDILSDWVTIHYSSVLILCGAVLLLSTIGDAEEEQTVTLRAIRDLAIADLVSDQTRVESS